MSDERDTKDGAASGTERSKRHLPIAGQAAPEASPDPALAQGMAGAQAGRRAFLGALGAIGATAAAVTANGALSLHWEDFFRQHYRRLDDDERTRLMGQLEDRVRAERGVEVSISDPQALDGVEFAYALNLSACTGCRQCEHACAVENNTSRDPQIHYIHVLELDAGTFEPSEDAQSYEGTVPRPGKVYMPVSCQQCANPPCVRACPVDATWRERDGIVVIDYDWCIGCRYCEAACPYGARHFNFAEPSIAPSEINPDQGYLSNRVRPRGVMEKCHFCLHRTRRGQLPACQEACPVGARHFGNLLDPTSEVRRILDTKRVYVLREELGTMPRFFYFFE
jgi:molybdopterin-containing oxidoreductase family iron-sulfur binding subunit